ncbi:MAG: hypothetical protein Q4Q17_04895 [Tissierellia bacterium]|nr:hypothetical protein [Tissierellia bacterium]
MKKLCIVIILVALMLLWFLGPLSAGFARLSAAAYLHRLGEGKDFAFIDVEFAPPYGEYFVYYKSLLDGEKEQRAILVGPKLFPFFIRSDSYRPIG